MLLILLLAFLSSPVLATPNPDIIIIGAGTAGCALAARLCAALPNRTLTLLERGTPRTPAEEFLVRAPRQTYTAWETPSIAEPIPVRPLPTLNGRIVPGLAGNTLGGSSAFNAMQWVVPRRGSVNSWGIRGLDMDAAMPYYRRAFHAVGFASQIKPFRHRHVDDILAAARRAGFKENDNPFSSEDTVDYFENRVAVDLAGRRRDSCTSYLQPVRETVCATNLRVLEGATVTRVVLSKGKNPRAAGVVYSRSRDGRVGKRNLRVRPGGEVIMSAGPFYSPKLLQLSGIGSPEVLKKAGIRVRVPLPVGEATIGRPGNGIFSLINAPVEQSMNTTLLNSPTQRQLWDTGRGGVFGRTSANGNGRIGADGYIAGVGNFADIFDMPIIATYCIPNAVSTGFMRVTSRNVSVPMDVNMAFLDDRTDVERMTRCLKHARRLHNNLPRRLNATIVQPPDGSITERWIRDTAFWAGHMVGGCPVGDVLTDKLRVRGVKGLRVVDASVFRNMPESAGPMASTYMLAEFMANVIEKEFK